EVLKQAAMIGMAKCYLGQKNEENYYSYLETIVKKFPHSFNTPKLIYEIAEYYYKKNDIENAKNFYHQIVERYKTSSVFHRAKRRLDEI
ncbi:MAG: tetratricopeptide repeat protein, partial [Candidatus Cloacimonetes bacterium]|nr:tetratricopeptide repeat protein [Candidatus Cloacimonadota bacterium]